jgi:hypothetical protein
MLPLAHAWSRRQKWLIIGVAVLGLGSFGALIYAYERYYRGPGQEILCGMWHGPNFFTYDPGYLELRRDGNFSFGTFSYDGQLVEIFGGRWYAGGTKIHLLLRPDAHLVRPWVLHIVDIEGDELRIRFFRDDDVRDVLSYRRVHCDSPTASNQAMERTATRRAFTFSMIKALSLWPTLALGGRRSSCSR